MKDDYSFLICLFIVLALVVLIVIGPFAVIWSMNNLFDLRIDYTFVNWVSSFILTTVVGTHYTAKSKGGS